MLFNSLQFVAFLALVVSTSLIAGKFYKNATLRNIILLCASYYFYGSFNIGFTLILAFVTIINFFAGNFLINFNGKQSTAKTVVAIASIASLAPLIFYKYALFLCQSISSIFVLDFNFELLESLALPIGISFFTFQALSFTIDAYRKKITEKANILNFALFVAFFPTILSGPIEKARNLLPQIKKFFLPNIYDISQGGAIFIWGLFKKMVVADRLAEYVDWAYDTSQYASGATLALAAIFYSIQIYCDFSGYSDMALGVAKTLGFNITKNFRQPYFAKSFKEFWHKWHISLTSWFTEYVYFSLGGSRVNNKLRWILNISTIFLLSGIWHGAAWNFLIWGALHAIFYLLEYTLGLQSKQRRLSKISSLLGNIYVFFFVTIAWIFFRVPSFENATLIIQKIFSNPISNISFGASSFSFAATIAMLAIFTLYEWLIRVKFLSFDIAKYPPTCRNILSVVLLLLLSALFGITSSNFVYFQF